MPTEHDFAKPNSKTIYAHTPPWDHLCDYDKTDQQYDILTGKSQEQEKWLTIPGLDPKVVEDAEKFLKGKDMGMKTKGLCHPVVAPQIDYYDAGGIGCIEYIKAKLTPEQYKGFLLGNILKYSSRMEHKGDAKADAKKLTTYSNWLEEVA